MSAEEVQTPEVAEVAEVTVPSVVEEKREIVVETTPIDPRFPATNQSRHCFVSYVEYHKCKSEAGEDDPRCARLARDYRSICPVEWIAAWNEARENGAWWGKY